ncbi:MAG: hypothetical protein EBZ48_13005, partial [Proteobacteria bacterium]|nr:hypothetical protein [Pseudomonadota bacterium]
MIRRDIILGGLCTVCTISWVIWLAGCSRGTLRAERIFQTLEQTSRLDTNFDFTVDQRCYRLEQPRFRALPKLLIRDCVRNSTRPLLDFAAVLPGRLTLLRGLRVSPDGRHLAVSALLNSTDVLFILNLDGKSTTPPPRLMMHKAPFEFEWFNDSRRLLLVRISESQQARLSLLDAITGSEESVEFTPREGSYLHLERSGSGNFLYLSERDAFSDRWSAIPSTEGGFERQAITTGERRGFVCDDGQHRLIAEDRFDAPAIVRITALHGENEMQPLSVPDVGSVAGLTCFAHTAVLTVHDGWSQRLYRLEPRPGRISPIEFSALWTSVQIGQPFDAEEIRVRLEDPIQPPRSGSVRSQSGTVTEDPPFPASRVEIERFSAPSSDGARVPCVTFSRPDAVRAGPQPVLLRAYGAYGQVVSGAFNPHSADLVARGFVVAV